jgi:hypothetical protein
MEDIQIAFVTKKCRAVVNRASERGIRAIQSFGHSDELLALAREQEHDVTTESRRWDIATLRRPPQDGGQLRAIMRNNGSAKWERTTAQLKG